MHTSPWSTGVSRCDGSSWYSSGTPSSAAGAYFSNTPASSARERKVLSTPKNTSPIGFDLVRITWLSAAPASPDCRTLTLTPVCFVKAASTDFDTAKESWVTSVIVGDDAADAGAATYVVTAKHAAARRETNGRRIRRPFRVMGRWRGGRRSRARPTRGGRGTRC